MVFTFSPEQSPEEHKGTLLTFKEETGEQQFERKGSFKCTHPPHRLKVCCWQISI